MTGWENSIGNRQSWPPRFSWTEIVLKPTTTRDWFVGKILGKPPIMAMTLYLIALAPKHATTVTVWKELQRKPPMMAITLFLVRDRAKASNDPRPAWEKVPRKSPIMAMTLSSIALVPNPAAGLGKTPLETANHGHFQEQR